jgi:hypothetical protein
MNTDELGERDERMPAATAAVVGRTNPSVLERDIPSKVAARLKDVDPDGTRTLPLRPFLERKRTQSGHARG